MQFLDEQEHEWQGTASAHEKMPQFWRTSDKRPYQGLCAHLIMDANRANSFKRIILAGGGTVVDDANQGITFVDRLLVEKAKETMSTFYDSTYLLEQLQTCGNAQLEDFLVQ